MARYLRYRVKALNILACFSVISWLFLLKISVFGYLRAFISFSIVMLVVPKDRLLTVLYFIGYLNDMGIEVKDLFLLYLALLLAVKIRLAGRLLAFFGVKPVSSPHFYYWFCIHFVPICCPRDCPWIVFGLVKWWVLR